MDKVPHRLATDFDSAREIFLPGQRAVNASKEEHFTLNDHCTDFVEASRDLSAMLKALAAFEEDPGRRFKIHKRRAAALEEPLNAMSRQMYLLVRISSIKTPIRILNSLIFFAGLSAVNVRACRDPREHDGRKVGRGRREGWGQLRKGIFPLFLGGY